MSETNTHRCQWLRQPHTLAALSQPGMSDGDKRACIDRHQCREVATWGVGDPSGQFALSCPGHLASVANAAGDIPTMVWPLWKENPRHPLQDEIDAVKRDRDAAASSCREVMNQRDDLMLVIRDAMHDLGGSVPQVHGRFVDAVKEMARAIGKYKAADRERRPDARGTREVLPHLDPPPAWFGGPLLDWLGIVYEHTGQRGIESLTVSRGLGMRLGLAPGDCMVLEGVRIDSAPADPQVQISGGIEVSAGDPGRWIADLDAMILKRRPKT